MSAAGPDLARLAHAVRDERLPAFVVDVAAFDRNAARLAAARHRDVPLRVASKSVRVPELIGRVLQRGEYAGVLGFEAEESASLARSLGVDVVVGYPVFGPELAPLLDAREAGADVAAMVDDPRQVALVAEAAARRRVELPVWLDVDVTWRPLGRHLGVRRSPIRDVEAALRVADAVAEAPSLRLAGVLAYEATVAGMPDRTPGSRFLDPIRAWVKQRSIGSARSRREQVVGALRRAGHRVDAVNGGGTGSVASTSFDPTVTEITVGSGLFAPHQFDRYHGIGLEPAAWIAVRVVRAPEPGWVTIASGPFVASGVGPEKAPIVVWPPDGRLSADEGWGEVQTPIRTSQDLAPGDVVLVRHSKAGEVLAQFDDVVLIENGGHRRVPTSRVRLTR